MKPVFQLCFFLKKRPYCTIAPVCWYLKQYCFRVCCNLICLCVSPIISDYDLVVICEHSSYVYIRVRAYVPIFRQQFKHLWTFLSNCTYCLHCIDNLLSISQYSCMAVECSGGWLAYTMVCDLLLLCLTHTKLLF